MSNDRPHGLALGHRGRLQIRLSLGALHLAEGGRPEALRAIVRHELAHLRNRDVDLGGLTRAAGRILLPVLGVVLVLGAVPAARRNAEVLVPFVGRLALLGLLVWLLRAAVLRSREHEADVRASIPAVRAGEPGFDPEFFPDPPARSGPAARWHGWWWAIAGSHPPADRRRAVVGAPERLLQAGFGEALATGVTAGLLIDNVRGLFLSAASGFPMLGTVLPGLVVGGLVTAVVGTALWRATLAALASGGLLPTGVPAGLGLAAGLAVGQLLGPGSINVPLRTAFATAPGLALGAMALLVLGSLLFTRWTVTAAASWLPAAGSRSLRPVLWAGHLAGMLACGAALMSFSGLAFSIGGGLPAERLHIAVLANAFSPNTAVPMLAAAVFPLVAIVRVGRPATPRVVDADSGSMVFLPRPRWRLAAVLVPAALVGLAASAVAVAGAGLLPTGFALSSTLLSRFGTPSPENITYGAVGLGGLVTLVAAVAAAAWAGGRGSAGTTLAHASGAAMLAAGALALVGAMSTSAACVVNGCPGGDPVLQVTLLPVMMFTGGIAVMALGLPLAAGIGRVGLLVRGLPAAWRETATVGRHRARTPPPRAVRALAVLVGIGVVLPFGVWSPAALAAADRQVVGVDIGEDLAAGSVPRDQACTDVRASALSASATPPAVVVSRVVAADDPALAAMGRVWRNGLGEGRYDAMSAGSNAAATFCELLRQDTMR